MKFFRLTILILLILALPTGVSGAELLVPGGQLIGLELQDQSVSVAGFDPELGAAARSAGLKEGDRLLRINKTPITCAEDIRTALSRSDGKVEIAIARGSKNHTFSLCPTATPEGPRLGVYLKQGTAGVGTVTYYDPDSGEFAALGHGVHTASGQLLQLIRGSVYDAQILSVSKGTIGKAGQLMGGLTGSDPIGSVSQNTDRGIFGTMDRTGSAEPLPVASREEVRTGSATILSTVADTGVREYSVEILKIYPSTARRNRNMLVKVTDPQLLKTTGGIVQGMSGSPIIQDGKLVGAVTHVLVNDPTTGYGIFIENMLDAAA